MGHDSAVLFSDVYFDDEVAVNRAEFARAPVWRAQLPNGVWVWVIGRHAEAKAALADTDAFRKGAEEIRRLVAAQLIAAGHQPHRLNAMFGDHLLFSDGVDHARLRRLVVAAFSPRRARAMQPRVREVTAQLLDHMETLPQPVDLLAEFALAMPLTIVCDLLGVPDVDRDSIRRWTEAMMREIPGEVEPASDGISAYVEQLIERKRAEPGDDLLTALIEARDQGDRLGTDELRDTVILLIVGGHETTAHALCNGIADVLAAPGAWSELAAAVAADPDDETKTVAAAVEELLRLGGALRHTTYRWTRHPVTVGEVTIPAEAIVLISVSAANRDPARFADPDRYRPGRDDYREHLSFGHGAHYCIGAALGRIEIAEALRALLQRYPHLRLADADPVRDRSPVMLGFEHLPVFLT